MKAFAAIALCILLSGISRAKQYSDNKVYQINTTVKKLASVFSSFNVHRQHNSATLMWTVMNNNVSYYFIERSYDGEYFDRVGYCEESGTKKCRFTDDTVEPGLIYYRVVAFMNDGSVETSVTQLVKIEKHK